MIPELDAITVQTWLKMIDSNNSGSIDNVEFELSLLTDEDLKNMLKLTNQVSHEDEVSTLSVLKQKMREQGLDAEELFCRINRTRSGEISLLEMRSGLLDLGF